MSNSRRISRPTTKKKNAISPSLIQCRRSSDSWRSPSGSRPPCPELLVARRPRRVRPHGIPLAGAAVRGPAASRARVLHQCHAGHDALEHHPAAHHASPRLSLRRARAAHSRLSPAEGAGLELPPGRGAGAPSTAALAGDRRVVALRLLALPRRGAAEAHRRVAERVGGPAGLPPVGAAPIVRRPPMRRAPIPGPPLHDDLHPAHAQEGPLQVVVEGGLARADDEEVRDVREGLRGQRGQDTLKVPTADAVSLGARRRTVRARRGRPVPLPADTRRRRLSRFCRS